MSMQVRGLRHYFGCLKAGFVAWVIYTIFIIFTTLTWVVFSGSSSWDLLDVYLVKNSILSLGYNGFCVFSDFALGDNKRCGNSKNPEVTLQVYSTASNFINEPKVKSFTANAGVLYTLIITGYIFVLTGFLVGVCVARTLGRAIHWSYPLYKRYRARSCLLPWLQLVGWLCMFIGTLMFLVNAISTDKTLETLVRNDGENPNYYRTGTKLRGIVWSLFPISLLLSVAVLIPIHDSRQQYAGMQLIQRSPCRVLAQRCKRNKSYIDEKPRRPRPTRRFAGRAALSYLSWCPCTNSARRRRSSYSTRSRSDSEYNEEYEVPQNEEGLNASGRSSTNRPSVTPHPSHPLPANQRERVRASNASALSSLRDDDESIFEVRPQGGNYEARP